MSEILVHDAKRLKELQALPLERKVLISQTRIIEWYKKNNGNVFISYSGGKDSTVLMYLVKQLYPDVPAVFSNTGVEYPEIQKFALKNGAEFVAPKMRFDEVILKYGYPLIGKEMSKTIYEGRRYKGFTKVRKQLLGIEQYEKSQYSAKRWLPLAQELPFLVSDRCCRVMKKHHFIHTQSNMGEFHTLERLPRNHSLESRHGYGEVVMRLMTSIRTVHR